MLTVASIPAAHPYVRSVVDPQAVTVLPDPVPPGTTTPGQWWPPRLLEFDYLRGRLDEIDVVHLHFGFDSHSPERLAGIVGLLSDRRTPLIVTVHDLQNPHFTEQAAHAARLDVLLPAATTVITLTDGAAAEIDRRWGREATVLPHPYVLPIDSIGARRVPRAQPVVSIHAKNLRANVDPWPLLDRLIVQRSADWCLRLDLDDEVLGAPRAAEAAAERLDGYRRAGVDVRVHRRFTDHELADYLTEVDVLVLPYRHGTHSGWVEACHDAGVQAVVPDCGYFHDQHGDPVFGYGTGYFDAVSFDQAVGSAVRSVGGSSAADPGRQLRRAEERREVREAMSRLYRGAVA